MSGLGINFMKNCRHCRYWEYWKSLLVDDDEPQAVGHCSARTIGGLTAATYYCGQWAEIEITQPAETDGE